MHFTITKLSEMDNSQIKQFGIWTTSSSAALMSIPIDMHGHDMLAWFPNHQPCHNSQNNSYVVFCTWIYYTNNNFLFVCIFSVILVTSWIQSLTAVGWHCYGDYNINWHSNMIRWYIIKWCDIFVWWWDL